MKRKHIAFVSFPRPPHVNPTLPIFASLVRRGHRVTYVTAGQFASRVVQIGAEHVPAPAYDFAGHPDDALCHIATETLEAITPFYEANRPDLVAYDFVAMAGRVLAHQQRVPAIKVSPHFSFSREAFPKQISHEKAREMSVVLSRSADLYLRRFGVPSSGYVFYRERLNIHPFPRDFDPNGNAIDQSCLYAGRCPGEQLQVGSWSKDFRDEKPIGAIVPSTTFIRGTDYLDLCVQALAGLPWNFVFFLAPDVTLSPSLLLPDNFRVVRESSPSKVFSHATALICMGGSMTVAEGIYHGLPLVMTSCGVWELEGLCTLWVGLGLGTHLKQEEMNVQSLRKAFTDATASPQIRARVEQMQRRIRCEPGAEEVASRVEEFIESYCDGGAASNTSTQSPAVGTLSGR